MTFDEILEAAKDSTTDDPEEMSSFIDQLIDAEDLDDGERGAFCAGYMAGMAHALGIIAKTQDPMDIVGEMMSKETGWHSRGFLD
jgi:hypothetical protein